MDKLVAFFKNDWLKRGVALLCWGYTVFVTWVAWLSFGFSFELENATALFVLYLFVNIAALGLMIYTRRQVFTMINCMILPPIVFVIIIFGFGNWYLILPPLVVVVAMFFINTANETLKTVLGTMYLLMYVIGIVGYVAVNLFMGDLTASLVGVKLHLRDSSYEKLSPSGDYRIVRYVDEPGERRTAAYYVESTAEDIEIPFGVCKKVFGSKHVHTQSYTSKTDDPVAWTEGIVNGEKAEMLSIEGSLRQNPLTIIELEERETGETEEDLSDIPILPAKPEQEPENDSTAETAEEPAE